jgi:hypothetical protein
MPVDTSNTPDPSRSTVAVISVSLVLREIVACRFKCALFGFTCLVGTERLSAWTLPFQSRILRLAGR